MKCASAVLLVSLLAGAGLPAVAQESSGTDVFEAHESPGEAMQRMDKAKKRPLRRGRSDTPTLAPYLPDDALRGRSLAGPGPVPVVSEDRGQGSDRSRDFAKDFDKDSDKDKGKPDKDHDHDDGHDDDRDDDDDDGDGGKKKGKG